MATLDLVRELCAVPRRPVLQQVVLRLGDAAMWAALRTSVEWGPEARTYVHSMLKALHCMLYVWPEARAGEGRGGEGMGGPQPGVDEEAAVLRNFERLREAKTPIFSDPQHLSNIQLELSRIGLGRVVALHTASTDHKANICRRRRRALAAVVIVATAAAAVVISVVPMIVPSIACARCHSRRYNLATRSCSMQANVCVHC